MMSFCVEATNEMDHWSNSGQWGVRDVRCAVHRFPCVVWVWCDGISLLYNCHQESYLASHADTQRHLVLLRHIQHTAQCVSREKSSLGQQYYFYFTDSFQKFPGVLFIYTNTPMNGLSKNTLVAWQLWSVVS